MFWLFNNNNSFDFYQIFTDLKKFNIDNSKNILYDLNNDINDLDIDLDSYEFLKINYQIKIIDNLISYTNLKSNKIITFLIIKKNVDSNICNLTNFKTLQFNYELVDNNNMPNLLQKYYQFYKDIHFTIYNINQNLLLIHEYNITDNTKKFYWLSQDIETFSKLIS